MAIDFVFRTFRIYLAGDVAASQGFEQILFDLRM